MRTYDDLSPDEQEDAVNEAASELLTAILEGLRFNDELNGDDLQARIDEAIRRADAMRTPWFADEYIMDTCRDDIMSMATADAETALYPEPNERIIRL